MTIRLVAIIEIIRRCGIQFPSLSIALDDFLSALQFLIVVILDAEGTADLLHNVLIGRRIVAAGCFIADGFCRFPVSIDVAGRHGRARRRVLMQPLGKLRTP